MPAPQTAVFGDLVAKYGINAAVALMQIFGGDASTASKAFTGAGLAGTGAQAAGAATGSTGLANLGTGVGAGVGAVGGIYNAATAPGYQGQLLGGAQTALAAPALANATGVGAGAIGGAAGGAAAASGYLAAAILTDYLINKTGAAKGNSALAKYTKGVDAFVKPQGVGALFGGHPLKYNLGQAVTGFTEDAFGATPFMAALGLGPWHKPTTGTMFRQELGGIFDKIPALRGIDLSKYNLPTGGYGQYAPGVFDQARAAGGAFASRTADAAKNPDAYATQATNILLSKYGNQLPDILKSMVQGAPSAKP